MPIPEVHQLESSAPPSEKDEQSPLVRSSALPEDENKKSGFFKDIGCAVGMHGTQEAFIRSVKAWILAAKVVSHRF